MTGEHRLSLSPAVAAGAVLAVLLIGAGATYLIMRPGSSQPMASDARSAAGGSGATTPVTPGDATSRGASSPRPDIVVTLTKEAAERAGIETTTTALAAGTDQLRLPGVVEPNGYRQVAVTPLVGGRVVSVSAQLGDRVRRGQVLARVYSPELSAARARYVAAKAMLDAHDRELQRTQKLVEIGAASRQELERIHAEHAAQTSAVQSARAQLQLLGASADSGVEAENSIVALASPIDGVVTERSANPGLNVDPSVKLFAIVDLRTVWIGADVYEKDFGRVRDGAQATVTAPGYPGLALRGRVSYIGAQVSPDTRTARARIEVANPRETLRLGMYMDVAIETSQQGSSVSVPKSAVQRVADRHVVYVAIPGERTTFVEREVRLGQSSSDAVEVVSGLDAGEAVVSKGSFFIRAEAERLGLRPSAAAGAAASAAQSGAEVQRARIAVTENGYEPDKVTLRAGVPVRLTFVRVTDKTCGTEIVFPTLNIRRPLPLNEPVVVAFTPAKTGEVAFACGMNMLKGVVVVR